MPKVAATATARAEASGSGLTGVAVPTARTKSSKRNCSTRLNDSFPIQDSTYRLVGIESASCRRANNGSNGGEQISPQFERNPPVTLRYVAVGRSSRSLPLLSGGASG